MNTNFDIPDRQRGAALIVGLVLMMVLTLLAISTMRTSTLELAMAGNAQYHEQATQLAEAGIEDAISQIENEEITLSPVTDWQSDYSQTVPTPDGDGDLGRYDVTIKYIHCGDAPSSNSADANFYEIEATGLSASRNAKSTFRQGFWIGTVSCTS